MKLFTIFSQYPIVYVKHIKSMQQLKIFNNQKCVHNVCVLDINKLKTLQVPKYKYPEY